MQLGRLLEATILYDAPDGRTTFRPWGPRGPCYLVDTAARVRFRRFVRFYYGLLFAAILVVPFTLPIYAFYIVIAAWTIGYYVAFWFLSHGLPTIPPPPFPSAVERDQALRNLSKVMGKPVQWTVFALSVLMCGAAVFLLLKGFLWQGVLGLVVFGACTLVLGWWLRKSRAV